MYWKLNCSEAEERERPVEGEAQHRFVLHRHRDEQGDHLDLRLETGAYLQGWRVDSTELAGTCWATLKAPHPLKWLDDDGDAERVDSGVYAWEDGRPEARTLVLRGKAGQRRIRIESEAGLTAAVAGAILRALADSGVDPSDGVALIEDGMSARRRSVERLCSLGKELDGAAFDEAVWRKSLEGLTLDEIHGQLRSFEVRFDLKYPPQPVSYAESLPVESVDESRYESAMSILRD